MEDALDTGAFAAQVGTETSDTQIADAARRDGLAFGTLYERYYARVYRYVYHRTGNPSDAEDITAVVFMKALEALPSYEPRRNSFAPWLFRITRNAVVDHYRRRRSQTTLDDVEREAGSSDPVSEVLGSEQRAELAILVEHLSVEQRDVILMRYAADLTFTEIASVLGKNEPAIRMLLHRGLRKLKAVMDDEHQRRRL